MAKPHRLAGSHLTLETKLAPRATAEAIANLAGKQGPWHGEIALLNVEGNTLTFKVGRAQSAGGAMDFSVTIVENGEGSRVTSKIGGYKVTQDTVFFIPVFPPEMMGYSTYKKFLTQIGIALLELDPSSTSTIVERV